MAYGARLESVLGASPRGFESPILRHHVRPCRVSLGQGLMHAIIGPPSTPLHARRVPRIRVLINAEWRSPARSRMI